ncbi:3-hydroxyacyl-ACP dehydratase FabZ family protein [Papillibacter cinnamivorans]|uniref:3-hydroxyacyl-[acyl-carrier-protein] dehydratase n=1 Tax=Papillibacter cinnamivorans DSM 12816 TaxID=1122930 RepID=A0A1W2AHQ2_9FIRM|nr:3-hydroxyacyl-ACP dehydratase FabZ family protein [Papillibacter cinnamivorans]SMC60144.1 3-hydroxyacyl-[acyl-carrier-protein] dehydratase [Papillibacter cinnamivorans DSM 12816]
MNRNEIKSILPHREPMLLIDEAELGEDGKARGRYTVRGDEWFLMGHFPGYPVVPGVIQCEMMAQACCVLLADMLPGGRPLFAGMDKVRFRGQVLPGDTIEFVCGLEKRKHPFYFLSGAGYVKGRLCVSGEMTVTLQPAG